MKSDHDVRQAILLELEQQLAAGAEKIEVQVVDGVVTLTGSLASARDGWRLGDAVRAMPGVTGLVDATLVLREASQASPDVARPWFPAS